jgi:hypothetical protein
MLPQSEMKHYNISKIKTEMLVHNRYIMIKRNYYEIVTCLPDMLMLQRPT